MTTKRLAAILLAALAACGGGSDDDESNPDGGANTPDGGVPVDATVPTPDAALEVVSVPGDPWEPTSCDALCAEWSYQCGQVCTSGGQPVAGFSTYRYDSPGGVTFYEQPPIETCEQPVSPTYVEWGDVYDLQDYSCCCLAPAVTRIDGDTDAPESCDSLCAAHDMACEPDTDWGFFGFDAMKLVYHRADGTRVEFTAGCTHVPSETHTSPGGYVSTLSEFTCGCR